MNERSYDVSRPDGIMLGTVSYCEWANGQKGWRFIPHFQRQPSRKLWPTADSAVRIKDAVYSVRHKVT